MAPSSQQSSEKQGLKIPIRYKAYLSFALAVFMPAGFILVLVSLGWPLTHIAAGGGLAITLGLVGAFLAYGSLIDETDSLYKGIFELSGLKFDGTDISIREFPEFAREELKRIRILLDCKSSANDLNITLLKDYSKVDKSEAEKMFEFAKKIHNKVLLAQEIFKSLQEQAQFVTTVSTQNARGIEAISENINKLFKEIKEISENVFSSAEIANQATLTTQETDSRVSSLAHVAGKINDVVTFIQEIANQTHILALNATIESTRAGEARKGFTVVALEVKNLANQTARAIDEISDQVNSLQGATNHTVTSIRSISETILEIKKSTMVVSDSITLQTKISNDVMDHIRKTMRESHELLRFVDKFGHHNHKLFELIREMEQDSGMLLGLTQNARQIINLDGINTEN